MSENAEGQFWNNANYVRWISSNLGHPIFIDPYDIHINTDINLLVLPGGSDVNPRRYMNYWPKEAGLPNRGLEYFDEVTLPIYIQHKIPIFGICRGLQTLNVLFGGTLKPDTPEPTSYSDGEFAHFVKYDNQFYDCSSNHHQSIDILADEFDVIMRGHDHSFVHNSRKVPDENRPLSIEGIKHKTLPILATQFHPEKQFSGGKCKKLNAIVHGLIDSIIK